ncbi:hypothetical protein EII25_01640 [Erysipelotrichaceae bacterium OH741_COT-311]|nr:hypothetical protein EII25_01640 [Erysipelotrichaceae bacterium OH741_COT-311]
MMKKRINIWTNVLFVGFLCFVSIFNLFGKNKTFSDNENRFLQQFPTLSLKSIQKGEFSLKFELWVQDQFVFRDTWIMVNTAMNMAMGKIENNNVYFGKDGYLIGRFFYDEYKKVDSNIESINNFKYPAYVMLIPSSAEVNKDKLPNFAYNSNQKVLEDYIVSKLQSQHTPISISDALSNCQDCFYRTDHHWNLKGANVAYTSFIKALGDQPIEYLFKEVSTNFKGTMLSKSGVFWNEPDHLQSVELLENLDVKVTIGEQEYDSLFFKNRLNEKDQYAYYLDGNHPIVNIENRNNPDGNHLLVIKDSFAHALVPMLVPHFHKITMIDLRYYKNSVSEYIQTENINDIIVMYNMDNFVTDGNLIFLK